MMNPRIWDIRIEPNGVVTVKYELPTEEDYGDGHKLADASVREIEYRCTTYRVPYSGERWVRVARDGENGWDARAVDHALSLVGVWYPESGDYPRVGSWHRSPTRRAIHSPEYRSASDQLLHIGELPE